MGSKPYLFQIGIADPVVSSGCTLLALLMGCVGSLDSVDSVGFVGFLKVRFLDVVLACEREMGRNRPYPSRFPRDLSLDVVSPRPQSP